MSDLSSATKMNSAAHSLHSTEKGRTAGHVAASLEHHANRAVEHGTSAVPQVTAIAYRAHPYHSMYSRSQGREAALGKKQNKQEQPRREQQKRHEQQQQQHHKESQQQPYSRIRAPKNSHGSQRSAPSTYTAPFSSSIAEYTGEHCRYTEPQLTSRCESSMCSHHNNYALHAHHTRPGRRLVNHFFERAVDSSAGKSNSTPTPKPSAECATRKSATGTVPPAIFADGVTPATSRYTHYAHKQPSLYTEASMGMTATMNTNTSSSTTGLGTRHELSDNDECAQHQMMIAFTTPSCTNAAASDGDTSRAAFAGVTLNDPKLLSTHTSFGTGDDRATPTGLSASPNRHAIVHATDSGTPQATCAADRAKTVSATLTASSARSAQASIAIRHLSATTDILQSAYSSCFSSSSYTASCAPATYVTAAVPPLPSLPDQRERESESALERALLWKSKLELVHLLLDVTRATTPMRAYVQSQCHAMPEHTEDESATNTRDDSDNANSYSNYIIHYADGTNNVATSSAPAGASLDAPAADTQAMIRIPHDRCEPRDEGLHDRCAEMTKVAAEGFPARNLAREYDTSDDMYAHVLMASVPWRTTTSTNACRTMTTHTANLATDEMALQTAQHRAPMECYTEARECSRPRELVDGATKHYLYNTPMRDLSEHVLWSTPHTRDSPTERAFVTDVHPCLGYYGGCRYAASCIFAQVPQNLCLGWLRGACSLGGACTLVHRLPQPCPPELYRIYTVSHDRARQGIEAHALHENDCERARESPARDHPWEYSVAWERGGEDRMHDPNSTTTYGEHAIRAHIWDRDGGSFAVGTAHTNTFSSTLSQPDEANSTPSITTNVFGQASLDAYAASLYEGGGDVPGLERTAFPSNVDSRENNHSTGTILAPTLTYAEDVLRDGCRARNSLKSDVAENDRSIATLGGVQVACTPSDQLLGSSTHSDLYSYSPHPHSGTTAMARYALPYPVLLDSEYDNCEASGCVGYGHKIQNCLPRCSSNNDHVSKESVLSGSGAESLLSDRVYRCLYDSFISAAHATESGEDQGERSGDACGAQEGGDCNTRGTDRHEEYTTLTSQILATAQHATDPQHSPSDSLNSTASDGSNNMLTAVTRALHSLTMSNSDDDNDDGDGEDGRKLYTMQENDCDMPSPVMRTDTRAHSPQL